MKKTRDIQLIAASLLIFSWACLWRIYFFEGFVLGDDGEELGTPSHLLVHGPILTNHLHLRFGVWFFNWIVFKFLDISEFSFFLPTVLISASLSVIGYWVLVFHQYSPIRTFFVALMMASAPFEVLIGTLRANDLILSWILALGMMFFLFLEDRPKLQGISLAFFLWFGFYVKLWIVYFLPILGIYYLYRIVKKRQWQGVISCTLVSIVLHGITCVMWKFTTGFYMPFIQTHGATYPVHVSRLPQLFLEYPEIIFMGSEFGTTLFGSIPYLLVAGVGLKIVSSLFFRDTNTRYRLDKLDYWLISYYGSFFLLINFFPNSFIFDQYYSVPRIFRYLTPLSFPMTLHLAKIILDFLDFETNKQMIGRFATTIFLIGFIGLNWIQTDEATKPGRIYRENLKAVIQDVKTQSPPAFVTEQWLNFFMGAVYLEKEKQKIQLITSPSRFHADQYETWLQDRQESLPLGTMLLTGLGSYTHYGEHTGGFRLAQFKNDLHPSWELVREYGVLSYLPKPESVKLWRLSKPFPTQINSSSVVRK